MTINLPPYRMITSRIGKMTFVLIDASRADFIDKDVVETIEDFTKHAHLKNITVEVKDVNRPQQRFAYVSSAQKNPVKHHCFEKESIQSL